MAQKRKTTRRQFLQGRSAAETLLDITNGGASAPPTLPVPDGERPGTYLLHFARAAMACDFEIFFNADESSRAGEAALEVLDLVESLEDQLTVYRDHSEVSRINRRAAETPVVVEARLFQLFQLAAEIYAATDGAFDITSGPLVKAWGFHRRAGRLPPADELLSALDSVGTRWLELNANESTIRFAKAGVEINLGAIGKGYTLDRCAEWFAAAGMENYIFHGGMSSVLARGTRAGRSVDQPGWVVGVVHPQRPDRRLAEILLLDRALGTSGAGTQFFYHQGNRYGHILDPRTGWPAEGVLSATVLAPTAAEADALATACYVLGVERTREICSKRPDVGVLFVVPGARDGSVEIATLGIDDSLWRKCD